MATPGVLNQTILNSTVINGDVYLITVDVAGIALNVNKSFSTLINQNVINGNLINGLVVSNSVTLTQTHIVTPNSCVMSLISSSPAPAMVFTFTPDNANITLTSRKVFITKGQGGNLFVTVTEPGATVHRFSFEGIKA